MRFSACYVLVCLCLLVSFASAGLVPGDTIVVFNSNSQVRAVSEAVANYYIAERDIPVCNKVGVDCPVYDPNNPGIPLETVTPSYFYQFIQLRLEAFLHEHFHSDEVPIGEDPIKAIVLCYGIPTAISGEIVNAVDSKLTMLFNETPWGNMFSNRFAK